MWAGASTWLRIKHVSPVQATIRPPDVGSVWMERSVRTGCGQHALLGVQNGPVPENTT